MALIKCAECAREISDKAAACPGCGAPVALQTAQAEISEFEQLPNGKWSWKGFEFNSREAAEMFKASRPPPQSSQEKPRSELSQQLGYGDSKGEDQYGNIFPDMKQKQPASLGSRIFGWLMIISIGGLAASCIFGGSKGSTSSNSAGISESRALSTCKEAIRLVSRDPDKADIPYAAPKRVGPDYSFTWTNGVNTIRLRNGLGMDVPASASCSVNIALGTISSLNVNGNTIVSK